MKKTLAIVLAVIMLFGMAACAAKTPAQTTETQTTEPAKTETKPAETKTETKTEEPASTEPDFSERITVNVWNSMGTDYAAAEPNGENIVLNWLTEQTNVEVGTVVGNGGSNYDAKMTQFIAAGTLPEVIITNMVATSTALAEDGLVYELTPELLEKYCPNIMATVPAAQWELQKVDGKIYSIPAHWYRVTPDLTSDEKLLNMQKADSQLDNQGLVIREDILQMLYPDSGYRTWDELKELMDEVNQPIGEYLIIKELDSPEKLLQLYYDIKDLGLTEGDMPVYPFGFNGGDNWMAQVIVGDPLIQSGFYYYTGEWNYKEQRWYLPLVEEASTKKIASMISQMIRDEVIEPESIIQTQAQWEAKVLSGNYAIVASSYMDSEANLNRLLEQSGSPYRYVPLVWNFYNDDDHPRYQTPNTAQEQYLISTSVPEDKVPQILRWLDMQYSDEFGEVYNWGPKEAGLYVENADGTRKFVNEEWNQLFEGKLPEGSTLTFADLNGIAWNNYMPYACMWTPGRTMTYAYVNNTMKWGMSQYSGFGFTPDHESTQVNFQMSPPKDGWDGLYADEPNIVALWETRGQWEDALKQTYVAGSDEEFERKWQDFIDVVNSCFNVEEMEEECTRRAREWLEQNS